LSTDIDLIQGRISCAGSLSEPEGRALFQTLEKWVQSHSSSSDRPMIVDLQQVTQIDSMAGAWLLRAMELAKKSGVEVQLQGMQGQTGEFLNLIAPLIERPVPQPARPVGFFEQIGQTAMDGLTEFKEAIGLLIEVIYWTLLAPFEKKRPRWNAILDEIFEMGVRAIPIVVLINYLLGLIISLMSAAQLRQFGADRYVADLVVIAFTRELAPIMTAIVIAARSGAAIAAELATMKVQEEVDALKSMGFEVTHFLISPKMTALTIALPCLTFLAMIAGVGGGAHVGKFLLDINMSIWIEQTLGSFVISDLFLGLSKSILFAVIIAFVGCHNGLRVQGGARGVGLSTTRAVVMDILLIICTDLVFTAFDYVM
jgi:phospholipid/cholesterol/gamma-HCH transport system permease protein